MAAVVVFPLQGLPTNEIKAGERMANYLLGLLYPRILVRMLKKKNRGADSATTRIRLSVPWSVTC
jgi:hypothetical protein